MTIERITKEKLDKIKDLIRDLDESARKNYGPGKFFTNETIKFDPNRKKLYIPEKKEEKKPTKQVSKPDVANDNGIDMLLL